MKHLFGERYRPIDAIGADHFGETYLAEDLQNPDRVQCVVKRLKLPSTNDTSLKLLLAILNKKAETLQTLGDYPQIPQLLDYFESDRSFYWVEELIKGRPLTEEIVPGQPLLEEQVIQLLTQVLKILSTAHDAGLIHGNIKPSNLIRRQSDSDLVLIGFDPFREICDRALRSQGRKPDSKPENSHLYTPPEQERGQGQFNSDIYALGVLAIQALTGYSAAELSPFLTNDPTAAGSRAWRNGIPISSALVKILNGTIHPDSQQRYQLAMEVLADLKKMQQNTLQQTFSTCRKPPEPPSPKAPKPKLTRDSPLPPPQRPKPADIPKPPKESKPTTRVKRLPGMGWGWVGLGLLGGLGAMVLTQLPQRSIATYLLHQGTKEEERGELHQALEYYDRALKFQAKNPQAYLHRGALQHKLGNSAEGLADFTEAIALQPRSAKAHYQRGNMRLEVGDSQGAIADYTEAIRLQPDHLKAYVNRGNAQADRGDDEKAVTDYTKALELDPTLAPAYSNRCLSRSNLGDHLGAISDCTRALDLDPTYTFAYQNRGLARRRYGDHQGAISDFNTAIELDPQDADPYYNRGLARQDLDDYRGAVADYSAAIARNSQHILAYYDRGLARAKIGDRQEAIADFRQTATLCLEFSRLGCYEDAQYQLKQLQAGDRDGEE